MSLVRAKGLEMCQMLVEREAALREVLDWEAGLQALHAHIALRWTPQCRAGSGVLLVKGWRLERNNGWQLRRIRLGTPVRWGAAVAGGVPLRTRTRLRDDLGKGT